MQVVSEYRRYGNHNLAWLFHLALPSDMTDYIITNGRSSAYPLAHYGGTLLGSRATFCETSDFAELKFQHIGNSEFAHNCVIGFAGFGH